MAFFKEEDYILLEVPEAVWVKNHSAIANWLTTLPDEDYEHSRLHLVNPGVAWGIHFRYKEDMITFKLKFGV